MSQVVNIPGPFDAQGHTICVCGTRATRLTVGPTKPNAGKVFYKCDNYACEKRWLYWQDDVDQLRAAHGVPDPGAAPPLSQIPSAGTTAAVPTSAPTTPAVARSSSRAVASTQPQPQPARNRPLQGSLSEPRTEIQRHLSRPVEPAAPKTPSRRRAPSPSPEDAPQPDEDGDFDVHATDDEYQSIDRVRTPPRPADKAKIYPALSQGNDGSPVARKRQRMPGAFTASTEPTQPRVVSTAATSSSTATGRIRAWRSDATLDDGFMHEEDDVFGTSPTQDTVPDTVSYPPSTPSGSPSRPGVATSSGSTAARMHGLAPSPAIAGSQGSTPVTIRLSQPSQFPMTPQTPGTASAPLSPEERLEAIANELPMIRRRFTAERKGHEFKVRQIEQLQREKTVLEREKVALHDRCSTLEGELQDRQRELEEARRYIAMLEGRSA